MGETSTSRCTEEIPEVAPRISEHADAPVRLVARRSDQAAPRVQGAGKRAIEVLDAKEQSDPPGELASDCRSLLVAVCASNDKPGTSVSRSHHDPTLRAAVRRHGRCVLGQYEAQSPGEEPDGGVIVVDDEREELQRHAATVWGNHIPHHSERWLSARPSNRTDSAASRWRNEAASNGRVPFASTPFRSVDLVEKS